MVVVRCILGSREVLAVAFGRGYKGSRTLNSCCSRLRRSIAIFGGGGLLRGCDGVRSTN